MADTLPWLPDFFPLTGDWSKDVVELHDYYVDNFIDQTASIETVRIFVDKRQIEDDLYEGFWHLVSKTNSRTKVREVDFERSKRILWCKAIIENYQDAAVIDFNYNHSNGKVRRLLWLKDYDYVVICQPYTNGKAAQLITAYRIEGESNRRWIETQYNNRIQ